MNETGKNIKRAAKFKAVSMDEGGRISFESMSRAGGFDVLHQIWSIDGIAGCSVIFANEDAEGLSDEEITSLVIKEFSLTGKIAKEVTVNCTSSRKETGYTFVNYGFRIL